NAFQRIDVTAQFLRQATLALDLAQGRYNLGLASIVELTQAQLNVTQAEIENLSAKYDYQTQNAALQYSAGLLRSTVAITRQPGHARMAISPHCGYMLVARNLGLAIGVARFIFIGPLDRCCFIG